MRIIIPGGSGLIGQALTKDFLKDRNEVIILSRSPEKTKEIPAEVKIVHWDGHSLGDWANIFKGADAVINLAGASIAGENLLKMRWTESRKRAIVESRLNAGAAVDEAIQAVNDRPKVLVQSSAIGFYGPLGNEPELGVRRIVLRTGLVFSRDGGIFPLLKLPFSLFMGGPLGSGKQVISWIHIDDMVSAIRFLIENQQTQGIYNLTAPNPVTNKEFSLALGAAMKRPSFVPVPGFAMKLTLGEVSTLALDGQRVIPRRLLEAGYGFKYKRLGDALTQLTGPRITG
jgi:NAD dependent epimerase/dehydratase family enzyme